MTALLELRETTKIYSGGVFKRRTTVALDHVSLSIGTEKPTITAIAGESGSGKTTMGMLFLGFLEPTQGEILYKGKDLWGSSKEEWRVFRREVQAIFQDPFEVYNPFYKVDHVLTVPIAKFGIGASREEQREMMEKALIDVGLRPDETLGRYPHQLSGGQRQRITVARALILQPKLIIADEPVSMVDASLRATILQSLRKLNKEMGISILYITHDLATAYHICENIMVLYQGSVAEAGDVDTVIKDPQHPYTRLLVGSIAWPDPKRKWGGEVAEYRSESMGPKGHGCKFAARCPRAMDICRESPPPLYQTNSTRAAACYLYKDNPTVEGRDIGRILGQQVEQNNADAS
jgi:oligopeptide/dipeptide ABC transporter ATP-binding protein